jgi:glutamyl-tRNA synthetase
MSIVTRFAPSPTGYLHLGNVRTGMIAYLFARSQNGKFVLRIDDTDLERSRDEYTAGVKEDLAWLGVVWDDYRHQKGREAEYDAARDQLIASGRLYPCYETEDELGLKRKSQLGRGLPPIYDRAGLSLTPDQIAAFEAEGRKPHYRFKLNHEPIVWQDIIRGTVSFHGKDLSDPVLIRADGSSLYHLGSVVDDIAYGITHIVRGEDHVSNTACHVQMFEALGATPPIFAHLPLVFDDEGKKFSKRMGSLNVRSLRDEEGFEPMAIVSLLARLGSADPIEPFDDLAALAKAFDINKFARSNPRFSFDELQRLNARLMHQMSFAMAQPRLAEKGLRDIDEAFWLAARPNLTKFADIADWHHVAKGDVQVVVAPEDKNFIAQAAKLLPQGAWDNTTWGVWVDALKTDTGRKGKELFMPLRLALTGMSHGPEMANLLPLIGYDKALARLQG